jgi:hypothetical protein
MRGAVGNALLRDSLAAGRADAIAGPGRPCSAPRWSPSARARVVSEEQPPDRFARSRSRWWVSSARAAHRSSARGSFVSAPSLTLCLGSAGASLLAPRCQLVSADSGRPAAIVAGRSVCETAGVASVSVALRRASSAGAALQLLHSSGASSVHARPLPRRHSCHPWPAGLGQL